MKYRVGGAVHASTYIGEFEADSPREAIEKAYRKAHVSVCHQCAEAIQDPEPAELWAEDEDGNVTHETSASHPAEVAAPVSMLETVLGPLGGPELDGPAVRFTAADMAAIASDETEAEVAAPPGERWIPVGERLPEDGLMVLFWHQDWPDHAGANVIGLGRFMRDVDGDWWEDISEQDMCGDSTIHYSGVTHWMPLPTPPTKDPTNG